MASALLFRPKLLLRSPSQLSRHCARCSRHTLFRASSLVARPKPGNYRLFHATLSRRDSDHSDPSATPNPPSSSSDPHPLTTTNSQDPKDLEIYHGPLRHTIQFFKLWGLSSLGICTLLAPWFIMSDSLALPLPLRLYILGASVSTYGITTGLTAWFCRPYVVVLRFLPSDPADPKKARRGSQRGIEMETRTWKLQKRFTRMYDLAFLEPSSRPLIFWELARGLWLRPDELEARKATGEFPREEIVAETVDEKGEVLGRWIVRWREDGLGLCREEGKMLRLYGFHAELLPPSIRWGAH